MMICNGVTKDCINHDSCGEICVLCNCCGRIDPGTAEKAQIKYYKECLEHEKNFNGWIEGMEKHQEKVRQENIKYYTKNLAKLDGEPFDERTEE